MTDHASYNGHGRDNGLGRPRDDGHGAVPSAMTTAHDVMRKQGRRGRPTRNTARPIRTTTGVPHGTANTDLHGGTGRSVPNRRLVYSGLLPW